MASYYSEANLLAAVGSFIAQGLKGKEDKRLYVCIPVDLNEIRVYKDRQGRDAAGMKINMWPAKQGITNYWKSRLTQEGKPITMYNVPTHCMEVGLSKERQELYAKVAKQKLLELHKQDWTTPEQQDENQNKEIRNYMYACSRPELSPSVWMREPKQQNDGAAPYQPSNVQQATQTASEWHPEFDEHGNLINSGNMTDAPNDLPF